MISFLALLALATLASAQNEASAPLPVVIWHGMGDSCCNPQSMGSIKKTIEDNVPGVYVLSIKIGDTENDDIYNSFLMDVNKQVEMVCTQLSNDPQIKAAGKYNAIGFSQGAQFLRAVMQRCTTAPPMNNLISIGGQHQGVFGMPKCPGDQFKLCDYVRELLNMGAYVPFVQNTVVQAQYWHDPEDEATYVKRSVFLADINQERGVNPLYKANFLRLQNFVLVKFLKDTMVQPRESEWFGYYIPGQSKETQNYTQTPLYQQDWIGLKQLDQEGRVHFLSVNDDHLRFTDQWFIDNIVNPYFKPQ